MSDGKLEKAILISLDRGDDLKFMFNPPNLSFTRKSDYNNSKGARNTQGHSKASFSNPTPCKLTLSQIPFDTYEDGESVLKKYIDDFKKAVTFKDRGKDSNKRPPRYTFQWGEQVYFSSCVITSLTYKLTMFLKDGTPVRAMLTLTIQEVDDPKPVPNPPPKPNRMKGRGTIGSIVKESANDEMRSIV
jgi:Contractile injection system tube protein